jgi:serine O-acetyltransferase
VVVGAGAKILGAITVGEDSRIGANAVVVKPVPPKSVVVGVPGQIISRQQPVIENRPDLEHNRIPDTLGIAVATLLERVDCLEQEILGHDHPPVIVQHLHPPHDGTWQGDDFAI